jgi:coenzyme F420-reducing hydrogenase delta subunit
MKRAASTKFPNSVQLFKFCLKVMGQQRNGKINDQEVGHILDFNPSDCSHWKRGEKNVKSVFALAKLAEALRVEQGILHDLASGASGLDEAYFEYSEGLAIREAVMACAQISQSEVESARRRISDFVAQLHTQSEFTTPPLYLPEVLRFFSFVTTQPVEMVDRLSRVLRTKPGYYSIQFRKGELKAQTRMSVARDLARIILDSERARFPELGDLNPQLLAFEQILFAANLLAPKNLMQVELNRLDVRRNVVSELASLFWAPKALVGFQIQEILRSTHDAAATMLNTRDGIHGESGLQGTSQEMQQAG